MVDCFNVRNTKLSESPKYKIIDLQGADITTLMAGRWCVNNGVANGETGQWFCEVIEYDDAYRTITAHPYLKNKKYFYFIEKVYYGWKSWEKYSSIL